MESQNASLSWRNDGKTRMLAFSNLKWSRESLVQAWAGAGVGGLGVV